MVRYATLARSRSIVGEDEPLLVGQTVLEADRDPVKTGLLTADGTPIYRIEDRAPMGFWVGGR